MNKYVKKFIKIIFLLVIIGVILLLIHAFRNFTIIKNLQKNIEQYSLKTNYHIKSIATEDNGSVIIINNYKKGEKQVSIIERQKDGETAKISMYKNGDKTDIFCDNDESKTAKLNSEEPVITINSIDYLYTTENNWQTFLSYIPAKIKSIEYNGKECYEIKGTILSSMILHGEKTEKYYIEKDTGLNLKSNINDIITIKEYEFDNIDDSIFIEPNINEYKVQ